MQDEYDFSGAKRGPVVPLPPGQVRVYLRLDQEVMDWFVAQVNAAGGGDISALINAVLREHIQGHNEPIESGDPG